MKLRSSQTFIHFIHWGRHTIPPMFEKYLGFLGHRCERNKPLYILKNYDFKDGTDSPTCRAAKETQKKKKNRIFDSVGREGGMI